MNHTFCFNCGSKLTYNLSKPNFCTSCGSSLTGGEAKAAAPNQSSTRIAKSSSISDDETDAEFVPQLNGLEVETEQYGSSFTLGSLAGDKTPPKFKGKQSYNLDEFTG